MADINVPQEGSVSVTGRGHTRTLQSLYNAGAFLIKHM